jgi:AcrR family transcriptional regulator
MTQNRCVPKETKTPSEPVRPLPGLRERKKARTKATIQREALRLFSEHGYAETSVEQIAAAAEVSPSTFFRYFPTKEEVVLSEFIDSRTIELFRSAPAELSPTAALRHAIDALTTEVSEEDLELESLRNELIQQVPELRRGLMAELLRPIQMMSEVIAERLGLSPDDEDAAIFAGALIGGMLSGGMMSGTLDADSPSDQRGHHPSDTQHLRSYVLGRLDRIERMLTFPPAERPS